jgi:hypothetical protein
MGNAGMAAGTGLAAYQGGSMALAPYGAVRFDPLVHPGTNLLPPKDLVKYENLPKSIHDQILDAHTYDHYGKNGWAFDADTLIDAPTG